MTGDRAVKAEGASGLDDEELLRFLQMLGDNFDITDMVQVSLLLLLSQIHSFWLYSSHKRIKIKLL